MIDVCAKIALSGHSATNLKTLRVQGNSVMATNLMVTMKALQQPIANMDCLVDAADFLKATKNLKNATFTQTTEVLEITAGKSKVVLPLLEPALFPFSPYYVPGGRDVVPENFAEAVKELYPFITQSNARTYVLDGALFAVTPFSVVRVPLSTKFPEIIDGDTQQPLVLRIPPELAIVMKLIPEALTSIRIDAQKISLMYGDKCWVESVRIPEADVPDIQAEWSKYDFESIPQLDPDLYEGLRTLCANAGKNSDTKTNDILKFGPEGVDFVKQNGTSWKINHAMPVIKFDSKSLKTILSLSDQIDFNNNRLVRFKSPNLEGIWAAVG